VSEKESNDNPLKALSIKFASYRILTVGVHLLNPGGQPSTPTNGNPPSRAPGDFFKKSVHVHACQSAFFTQNTHFLRRKEPGFLTFSKTIQ
jgi:hypothetical protein